MKPTDNFMLDSGWIPGDLLVLRKQATLDKWFTYDSRVHGSLYLNTGDVVMFLGCVIQELERSTSFSWSTVKPVTGYVKWMCGISFLYGDTVLYMKLIAQTPEYSSDTKTHLKDRFKSFADYRIFSKASPCVKPT